MYGGKVGTRRWQYLFSSEVGRLFCLFTPQVSASYYYRTVLGDGDQRTARPGTPDDLVLGAVGPLGNKRSPAMLN